jgi:hypothetical protein
LYRAGSHARKHYRQDVAQQLRAAPPTFVDAHEFLVQGPRVGGVFQPA